MLTTALSPMISPDSFSGTDSEKIQAAVTAAIVTNGLVDLGTRSYVCDRGIVAKEPKSYITFSMQGSGKWNQITFTGKGSFLHIIGGKNCKLERIGILLKTESSVGLEIGTDETIHSTSGFEIESVRFQPQANNCTGFLIGTGPNGDDVAWIRLKGCEVYYDSGDNSTPHARWLSSLKAGNVGFSFVGSNHLVDTVSDCSTVGMLVGLKTINHLGYQSGANNIQLINYGGGFNGLMAWFDGGHSVTWNGGRCEESGGLILHGDKLQGGRQRASVSVSGVILEDIFMDGIPGLLAPREVIGLRSASKYIFTGVQLNHIYFGDKIAAPDNVVLDCADPAAKPNFAFDNGYMANWVNGVRIESPLLFTPKNGAWRCTTDGMNALLSVGGPGSPSS